jgi:hypothetical protein
MRFLFFIAVILILVSCKKKKSETTTSFQWPDGTGEYAPYTMGSTFTFETNSATGIDSFTYTVKKDTVIDGLKCMKLESNKPLLASNLFVNYGNGVRTEFSINGNFNGIALPSPLKQEVLKEATAINGTWSSVVNINVPAMPPTIPIPLTIPVNFNYTMMQKDIVKNILSKDYSGTYAVKLIGSLPANIAALLPAGTPSSMQVDAFYSKGVGLSQRVTTANTASIKRYNVIK